MMINLISTATGFGVVRFFLSERKDKLPEVYFDLYDVCNIVQKDSEAVMTLLSDYIRTEWIGRERTLFISGSGAAKLTMNTLAENWFFDLQETVQLEIYNQKAKVLKSRIADREKNAQRWSTLYKNLKVRSDKLEADLKAKKNEITLLNAQINNLNVSIARLSALAEQAVTLESMRVVTPVVTCPYAHAAEQAQASTATASNSIPNGYHFGF